MDGRDDSTPEPGVPCAKEGAGVFRFEKEPNSAGRRPLNFYRVIDEERGLKLELRERDQNSSYLWFWWEGHCFPIFVEQSVSETHRNDINLSIETARLQEKETGNFVDDQGRLKLLVPLLEEALEALWRSMKSRTLVGRINIFQRLLVK